MTNKRRLICVVFSITAVIAILVTILGSTLTYAFSLLYNFMTTTSAKSENGLLGTLIAQSDTNDDTAAMNNLMCAMMKAPQDVIIKQESNPIIPVRKESEIKLSILGKESKIQKPMIGAQVLVGIWCMIAFNRFRESDLMRLDGIVERVSEQLLEERVVRGAKQQRLRYK